MKPYLRSIFLLFLILLDQSISASAFFNGLLNIEKWPFSEKSLKWGKVGKETIDSINDYLKKELESPPALPKQINIEVEGLSVVKYYLSDYGYIESSGPFTYSFDQEIISAIKTYQNFSNLQVTGGLNKQLILGLHS